MLRFTSSAQSGRIADSTKGLVVESLSILVFASRLGDLWLYTGPCRPK